MKARHDEYYLREVTSLGDVQPLVANAPIYGQNHIKLVDIGTQITSTLFDKLVCHKIEPSIDECLTVENGVTADALFLEAKRLIGELPFLSSLANAAGSADDLLAPLRHLVLEPVIAFKLTVMRERRILLFHHSLEVAIIALFLGRARTLLDVANLDVANLHDLAAAALFHDIGVLHINPEILDPAHEITDEELQHVYAHPITAFLILKEYPSYSPDIRTAVLEHHERWDGSGYPRCVKCHETSFLGRILVLAEVVASLAKKPPYSGDLSRICIALKFCNHKYDPMLVSHLVRNLNLSGHTCVMDKKKNSFLSEIEKLGNLIGDWQSAYDLLAEGQHSGSLVSFVNSQLTELEHALSDAGCHPLQLSLAYQSIGGDSPELEEMVEVADECAWQFRYIVHETHRRWGTLKSSEEDQQLVRRWLNNCDVILQSDKRSQETA